MRSIGGFDEFLGSSSAGSHDDGTSGLLFAATKGADAGDDAHRILGRADSEYAAAIDDDSGSAAELFERRQNASGARRVFLGHFVGGNSAERHHARRWRFGKGNSLAILDADDEKPLCVGACDHLFAVHGDHVTSHYRDTCEAGGGGVGDGIR
ncbi:MAG TPA: hypothetical protein PKE16_14380, partial [Hyphomicrobium sp.]|nr:hypothetical protein [Hyphomicrobium sp.]